MLFAVCRLRSSPEASTPWSVRRDVAKVRCSIFSVCLILPDAGRVSIETEASVPPERR